MFLAQISPYVNVKIILVAEDIYMSSESYVNLENNT